MNPEQLPLEPLMTPPPTSWWPLAPIWWVLLAITILSIILIVALKIRKKHQTNVLKTPYIDFDLTKKAALTELANMQKPYEQAAGIWLQQINKLLKQICNLHYPTEGSKALMGQYWLNFLDNKCPTAQIKKFPILVEGTYQENYHMDKATIDALYLSLEHWITHHV